MLKSNTSTREAFKNCVFVLLKDWPSSFVKTFTQSVLCSVPRHHCGPWSALREPQGSKGQNGNSWNHVGASGKNSLQTEPRRAEACSWKHALRGSKLFAPCSSTYCSNSHNPEPADTCWFPVVVAGKMLKGSMTPSLPDLIICFS